MPIEADPDAVVNHLPPKSWCPPEPPTHHAEAATLEREFGPADENGVYGARS